MLNRSILSGLAALTYFLILSAIVMAGMACFLVYRIDETAGFDQVTDGPSPVLSPVIYCGTYTLQSEGEKLFKANCGSCHIMGRMMVGPNLEGMATRMGIRNLFTYLTNPQVLIDAEDPYMLEMTAKWVEKSGYYDHGKDSLSNAEIDLVIAYVDGGYNLPTYIY